MVPWNLIAIFESPRLYRGEVTEAAAGHIISVIPAVVSLCLVWEYCVFVDQSYGKHCDGCRPGDTLGTVAMPSRSSKAPYCPWVEGKPKENKQSVERLWTSPPAFKEKKILRKYHFSQYLTTSMLSIKNHLKHFLQRTQLRASIPAEDRNSCETAQSHAIEKCI